jgi:serine/threonine protein kinase
MGNFAQRMRGRGGVVSTDENYRWTEVRASNGGALVHGNSLKVFDPASVRIGRQIGEGGQGCIFEAKFYHPFSFKPFPVVVKRFKPLLGISQGRFPREMDLFQCYNVCKPFGAVLKGDSLCLIMVRFSCDLRTLINAHMHDGYSGPPFPTFQAELVILQLAIGMRSLHELGIYHRDLKAENILVSKIRAPDCPELKEQFEIYVADFERSEDVVGTAFYRAPEVLQYLRTRVALSDDQTRVALSDDQWKAADIYSFGMVCYEVLTGKAPFGDHPPRDYDLVLNGGRPELPDHVPEHMKGIMRRCWHADPSFRPSWTEIVQVLTENSDALHFESAPTRSLTNYVETIARLRSSAGASIESNLVELKQSFTALTELDASESKGFANSGYWAAEFIATAEELVTKYDIMDSPSNNPLLCRLPEYLERLRVFSLLQYQFLAYNFTTFGWELKPMKTAKPRVEITFLLTNLFSSVVSQLFNVQFSGEFNLVGAGAGDSWVGLLLFYHAFIWCPLWTNYSMDRDYFGKSTVKKLQELVRPRNGAREFILFACLMVVALVETYVYVLAVFTCEPILLCVQYGLYRMNGPRPNFLYRSSGYRVCRLQRAWVNYTRYKPLSAALILSLLYLVTNYKWKGFVGWIVFPTILRISPWYWR